MFTSGQIDPKFWSVFLTVIEGYIFPVAADIRAQTGNAVKGKAAAGGAAVGVPNACTLDSGFPFCAFLH